MKREDFMKMYSELLGEDVGKFHNLEKRGVKRSLSILLRGKYAGVKYPISDRLGVLAIIVAGLMFLLSFGSLAVTFLRSRMDLDMILVVDRAVGDVVLGLLDTIHRTGIFLIDNPGLTAVLSVMLLWWLARR